MTKHYPECDSYECDGCPRELECDIKDEPDDLATEPSPLDIIVYDLSERLDLLRADLDKLTASVDSILAAVVRARAGEER